MENKKSLVDLNIRNNNKHGNYIYIYIYIFTNLISTSIHGTRKKKNKPWPGTRDKNITNHHPGEKEKSFLGKKRKKRPTSSDSLKKIKGYAVSGQKKTKKPSANAAITKVLNTIQWSQL